ncbi:MAG: T9SS type A sorting domain-containing protein [Pricia sp.]
MMKKLLLTKIGNHTCFRVALSAFMGLVLTLTAVQEVRADDSVSDVPLSESMFTVDGGTISGGPFEFCVGDGQPDNVSGITLECKNTVNSQWVVTDEDGKILGLPPQPEAVDFDGAGAGVCLIWHLSYADGLEGLEEGNNALTDLTGEFDFSNSIKVYRNQPEAGTLVGGPYVFDVDGEADFVTDLQLTGTRSGTNSTFVITDDQGAILGLPFGLDGVAGVNFDDAGAGTCLIWHLRFEDGLQGAEIGANANDLVGCFDLSNPIEVVRNGADDNDNDGEEDGDDDGDDVDVTVNGGVISGGPFQFCIDGNPDMVSGITLDGSATGSNSTFAVTDDKGNILAIPPTMEALEGVNFDDAGLGTCLIWYIRFEGELEGAEIGENANDIQGNFDLSNPIEVVRTQAEAGILTGGPFEFEVDGEADFVSGITVTGDLVGANTTFIVTDDKGNILALPPTIEALEGVNFDEAGPGTCLIWHLKFADGLQGAEEGLNANDLVGCFDLSNPLEVVRNGEEETDTDGDNGEVGVTMAPMPATDVLNISLQSFTSSEVQIGLFDVTGHAVKNSMNPVIDRGVTLNVQSVPSGLYLLRVSDASGKSVTKKVVIQ